MSVRSAAVYLIENASEVRAGALKRSRVAVAVVPLIVTSRPTALPSYAKVSVEVPSAQTVHLAVLTPLFQGVAVVVTS